MKTILVVDDNPFITDLFYEILGIKDYRVLKAKCGDEAINIATLETPDLILMDIVMPGKFDGVEAMQKIKSNPDLNKCKVVLLTAKGQDEDFERGLASGASEYIVKPFSPESLLSKINSLLN